jgi:hypothetical protein
MDLPSGFGTGFVNFIFWWGLLNWDFFFLVVLSWAILVIMNRRLFVRILVCLLALGRVGCWGQVAEGSLAPRQAQGLRNAVVLIIRHAEKPSTGYELTPEGIKRARAYVEYFKHFEVDSKPLQLNWLFAARDSKSSHRPRLTLEPLSGALGCPLDTRFKAKEPEQLAQEIKSTFHGKGILICWHHGQIPDLIRALGGQPEKLLPRGEWPSEVFNWVVELRYDEQGRLIPGQVRCINENLMAGDAENHDIQQ